jgi:murein DD-endopeptidase MepM/ murein hydrolase activator NlpD
VDRFPLPPTERYRYANEWTEKHHGTDIFAERGTPVVAVASGRASVREDPKGGHTVELRADNGWRYYYAHLDSYAPALSGAPSAPMGGVVVAAGDLLGTVGNTGNAKGTSPHLHFQLWPPGGSIADPWPYLVEADTQLGPTAPDALPPQDALPEPPADVLTSSSSSDAGAGALVLIALAWFLRRKGRR